LDSIGRLEVGTETLIDKAKSVKTYLMQLFPNNTNIEGVDTVTACYGGTNALFNAINWIESKSWDGRNAIVVAADIALYAPGPARATGGCGAVVMLVGPNAPLVLETGLRGSYMEHSYDFYKPNPKTEYPVVDGKLSVQLYFKALDKCYEEYTKAFKVITSEEYSISKIDHFVCHSPYNKLIHHAFARMMFNEFVDHPDDPQFASMAKFKNTNRRATLQNRALTNGFLNLSAPQFKSKVEPSTLLPVQLGNLQCAAVWSGLLSLIDARENQLIGSRILMFSYGSGLASSMFSFVVKKPVAFWAPQLRARLSRRSSQQPHEYTTMLEQLEERYLQTGSYIPVSSADSLLPGTYYLDHIDSQSKRFYKRVPLQAKL